jgi:hypothetical protein
MADVSINYFKYNLLSIVISFEVVMYTIYFLYIAYNQITADILNKINYHLVILTIFQLFAFSHLTAIVDKNFGTKSPFLYNKSSFIIIYLFLIIYMIVKITNFSFPIFNKSSMLERIIETQKYNKKVKFTILSFSFIFVHCLLFFLSLRLPLLRQNYVFSVDIILCLLTFALRKLNTNEKENFLVLFIFWLFLSIICGLHIGALTGILSVSTSSLVVLISYLYYYNSAKKDNIEKYTIKTFRLIGKSSYKKLLNLLSKI